MTVRATVALAAAACAGCHERVAAPTVDERAAAMSAAIEKVVAAGPYAGMAVVVTDHGKAVLARGFGTTEAGGSTPITADTVFEIGSITKQFTAAAALTLVDAHRIALADPVAKYVPQITSAVTVQQLLNQTSGLAEYAYGTNIGKTYPQLVDVIAGHALEFAPGTRWQYANTNYFLLSRVIEHASGVSYAQYVREHVIEAAHLRATRYCADDSAEARPTTSGHAPGADAWSTGPTVLVAAKRTDQAMYDGAGALCSTANDLVAWHRELFAGHVVSPASLAVMTTAGVLADGNKTTYGAGLAIDTIAKHRRIWHNGAVPNNYEGELSWFPDDGLQIAILANTEHASAGYIANLDRALAKIALHVETPPPKDVPLPAEQRARYIGTYTGAASIAITLDGDRLRARQGGKTRTLRYQGDDVFAPQEAPEVRYHFVGAPGPAETLEIELDGEPVAKLQRAAT